MSHKQQSNNLSIISRFTEATVVGLGVSGYSAARYLRSRGLTVHVVDTRPHPPLAESLLTEHPEVETFFGSLSVDAVKNAKLLIVSPGVSLGLPDISEAKKRGAEIVGDIELFLQENEKPLIAITGSNGKSTVTTLVGEMCRAGGMNPLVAGNIGEPVLNSLIEKLDYDVAVLELSSFQLETTSIVPAESATILNISADHMDRYASMGDYMLAKARIMRGAQRAVLSRHEPELEQITKAAELIYFGLDKPAADNVYGIEKRKSGRWLMKGDETLMRLRDVPLVGLHNTLNVLAAFALTDFLAIDNEKLVGAIKSFEGLPHRMQTVAIKDGVTYVNDSKATNIGAAATALKNLESPVYWIAGGEGKGADFTELRDELPATVQHALLIGRDAKEIEAAIETKVPTTIVASLDEAVYEACKLASSGSVVLLSPACASFDMFNGFAQRGEEFVKAVKALPEASSEVVS